MGPGENDDWDGVTVELDLDACTSDEERELARTIKQRLESAAGGVSLAEAREMLRALRAKRRAARRRR